MPSGGVLAQSQIDWLTGELKAAATDRPVIVALHHPPYSVDAFHGGSQEMGTALDGAFGGAPRWPELVLTGHVHDFQCFTRQVQSQSVRYVVSGNSGAVPGMNLGGGVTFEYGDASGYGFLALTVAGGAISGQYVGVTPGVMPDGSDAHVTPNKHQF